MSRGPSWRASELELTIDWTVNIGNMAVTAGVAVVGYALKKIHAVIQQSMNRLEAVDEQSEHTAVIVDEHSVVLREAGLIKDRRMKHASRRKHPLVEYDET